VLNEADFDNDTLTEFTPGKRIAPDHQAALHNPFGPPPRKGSPRAVEFGEKDATGILFRNYQRPTQSSTGETILFIPNGAPSEPFLHCVDVVFPEEHFEIFKVIVNENRSESVFQLIPILQDFFRLF
jgi:hypothetical protein